MIGSRILALRQALGLSQIQFAELFGAHFMSVSKWERGVATPTPYQIALMEQFERTAAAKQEETKAQVKNLLVGAGVVAALIFLLNAGKK